MSQANELQDWSIEATDAAEVIDFVPAPMLERENLAGIALRLMARQSARPLVCSLSTLPPLTGRSLNQGSLDSLLPWLHNETPALKQTSLLVCFNRPLQHEQ